MKVGLRQKDGEKKPTRYYSHKQETAVAKKVGGQVTPNSGATLLIKGDVTTNDSTFLIECKTKTKPSKQIAIHKEWIEKNKAEALFMGKHHSTIAFSFGPDEENYYIIDEELFLILCEVLKNESSK